MLSDGEYYEAELIFHDLIHRNPENHKYYEKLEQCLDLCKSHDSHVTVIDSAHLATVEDRMELYRVLREEFPRSHVCRKIPLGFVKGLVFHEMIDKYLRPSLHKGVPSLWIGLKGLYGDQEKVRRERGRRREYYTESLIV